MTSAPTGGSITLRPEDSGDEIFLFEVYASTRSEELDATGWDMSTRTAFLNMQFRAMRQGYRTMYPGAEFSIILCDGQPIGRQVVDRSATDIRVVDVALLPAYRCRGIGASLMKQVQTEAAASRKPVTLSVLSNSPALRLYERLGFVRTGPADLYQEMRWTPQRSEPA